MVKFIKQLAGVQDTIDAVADVTIECPNKPSEVFA